jgi:RHS repeat-associated protein
VVVAMAYGPGQTRIATLEGDALTLYASADFEVRDGIGVLYGRLGSRRIGRAASDALAPRVLGDPAPLGAPDGVVTAGDAWIGYAAGAGIVVAEEEGEERASLRLRSAARRLLAAADAGPVMLHTDHLGNLVLATDATGSERGRRRFALPTGEDRSAGFVDAYGLGGQESIASLGLVRFAYRWLDPVTRRWMQPDPIATYTVTIDAERADEAADPYAYVGNRFLAFTDPLGLSRTSVRDRMNDRLHKFFSFEINRSEMVDHIKDGSIQSYMQHAVVASLRSEGLKVAPFQRGIMDRVLGRGRNHIVVGDGTDAIVVDIRAQARDSRDRDFHVPSRGSLTNLRQGNTVAGKISRDGIGIVVARYGALVDQPALKAAWLQRIKFLWNGPNGWGPSDLVAPNFDGLNETYYFDMNDYGGRR